MPAISQRGLDRFEFLSDDLRAAIRRRIGELCGLSLLLVALAVHDRACDLVGAGSEPQSRDRCAGAQLAWTPRRDLRRSVGPAFRSGVDHAGAADRGMGLAPVDASCARPSLAARWRSGSRALVLASAFASCLPRTIGWPLPAGMGGVTGDAIVKLPLLLFGGSGTSRFVLASIIGIATIAAIAVVLGFGFRKRGDLAGDIHREAEEFDEDEERGSVSLGWLVHLMLSAKARLSLFIRRRLSGDEEIAVRPARPAAGTTRVEPRMQRPEPEDGKRRRGRGIRAGGAGRRRGRTCSGAEKVAGAGCAEATPFRQLRAAAADAAGPGQGERQGNDRAPRTSRRTPSRSKACWKISASRARSSMRVPARW